MFHNFCSFFQNAVQLVCDIFKIHFNSSYPLLQQIIFFFFVFFHFHFIQDTESGFHYFTIHSRALAEAAEAVVAFYCFGIDIFFSVKLIWYQNLVVSIW